MKICFCAGILPCCKGCSHAVENDTKFVEVIEPHTTKKVTKDACSLGCGKDAKQKCVTIS